MIQDNDNIIIESENSNHPFFNEYSANFFHCQSGIKDLKDNEIVSAILLPNKKIFCALPNGKTVIYG